MRRGLAPSIVPELSDYLKMDPDDLCRLLRISGVDVRRRLAARKALQPTQQDRIYRAMRLLDAAVQTLEDEESARLWVRQPNRTLGGEAPLALMDTREGYEMVLTVLARITFGVVA
jgi:putative toxin-antitoxin system antitoxin component (TIGR02293 family)